MAMEVTVSALTRAIEDSAHPRRYSRDQITIRRYSRDSEESPHPRASPDRPQSPSPAPLEQPRFKIMRLPKLPPQPGLQPISPRGVRSSASLPTDFDPLIDVF
jgi:hypothetical protein